MAAPAREIFIYGLYDPSDDRLHPGWRYACGELIRYVGWTFKPKRRCTGHIYEATLPAKSHRLKWVRSLLRKGVSPKYVVLDTGPAENWAILEIKWIAHFPKGQLTNSTIGGEGIVGLAEEARARIGAASKVRMKGNTIRRGAVLTEEQCKDISEGLRNSEKAKAEWIRRKGWESYVRTQETLAKMSASATGKSRPDVGPRTRAMNKARRGKLQRITNGTDNLYILKTEPIPEGWWLGVTVPDHHLRGKKNPRWVTELKKQGKKRKGKMRWITNGERNKMWFPGDEVPPGWRFGKKPAPRNPDGSFKKKAA